MVTFSLGSNPFTFSPSIRMSGHPVESCYRISSILPICYFVSQRWASKRCVNDEISSIICIKLDRQSLCQQLIHINKRMCHPFMCPSTPMWIDDLSYDRRMVVRFLLWWMVTGTRSVRHYINGRIPPTLPFLTDRGDSLTSGRPSGAQINGSVLIKSIQTPTF